MRTLASWTASWLVAVACAGCFAASSGGSAPDASFVEPDATLVDGAEVDTAAEDVAADVTVDAVQATFDASGLEASIDAAVDSGLAVAMDAAPESSVDASVDAGAADTGGSPIDSGTPTLDSGLPALDSGLPALDAGATSDDAGAAWVLVGTGDCTGNDQSIGYTLGSAVPVVADCTAADNGVAAVCWDQVTYTNPQVPGGVPACTYKTIPPASCSGGASPGTMYVCIAP